MQNDGLSLAGSYHDALPWRIRRYLVEQRGIRDDLVDEHLLGWNGRRITIPVFDQQGEFAFFKLAKDPEDKGESPKMLFSDGGYAELYGWERVKQEPQQLIICEGELDRLVLESHGFAAVTSTAGAGVFKKEWADALSTIPEIYVCFDRDKAGRDGAAHVARLLPKAKVIELPGEVGEGGDVTDLFVRLGAGRAEFLKLMADANPVPLDGQDRRDGPRKPRFIASGNLSGSEVERLRQAIPIADVIAQYTALKPTGKALKGRCPFHEDRVPSLAVYPETGTYHCFGCGKHGDVYAFVMEKEGLSFRQALATLSSLIQKSHGAP